MKKISILFFLLVSFIVGAAQALTVLSLNLEQLSQLADQIFVGQVLSSADGWDSDGRPIVTVALTVTEKIKGELGATYQFKQIRSFRSGEAYANDSTLIESMPEYKVGSELVLFMSRPSDIGLTAPIGIFQGKFEIIKDAAGNSVVTNQVRKQNLFLKMKKLQKTEDFLSIVRKLAQ